VADLQRAALRASLAPAAATPARTRRSSSLPQPPSSVRAPGSLARVEDGLEESPEASPAAPVRRLNSAPPAPPARVDARLSFFDSLKRTLAALSPEEPTAEARSPATPEESEITSSESPSDDSLTASPSLAQRAAAAAAELGEAVRRTLTPSKPAPSEPLPPPPPDASPEGGWPLPAGSDSEEEQALEAELAARAAEAAAAAAKAFKPTPATRRMSLGGFAMRRRRTHASPDDDSPPPPAAQATPEPLPATPERGGAVAATPGTATRASRRLSGDFSGIFKRVSYKEPSLVSKMRAPKSASK